MHHITALLNFIQNSVVYVSCCAIHQSLFHDLRSSIWYVLSWDWMSKFVWLFTSHLSVTQQTTLWAFCRYWLNIAVIVISFLIALLVLASWIDPRALNTANPDEHIYVNGDNSSITKWVPACSVTSSPTQNQHVFGQVFRWIWYQHKFSMTLRRYQCAVVQPKYWGDNTLVSESQEGTIPWLVSESQVNTWDVHIVYCGFLKSEILLSDSPIPGYRSELANIQPIVAGIGVEQLLTYIMGGLHNIISLCVVISFFLSNHPRLPTLKSIKQSCMWVLLLCDDCTCHAWYWKLSHPVNNACAYR